jgi:hypothetical protein
MVLFSIIVLKQFNLDKKSCEKNNIHKYWTQNTKDITFWVSNLGNPLAERLGWSCKL